jgi:hypothetical protein
MWCIGTITGEYLANLEDVLDVYAQPTQAGVVRLCFDERPCQLLDHVLMPLPAKPNATQKEHQEYLRKGVCNVLLAYNIDTGQRHLQVRATKTKADYAHFMDWLVQAHYPQATTIKLVQDNYSTHRYGAFYEHLPFDTAAPCGTNSNFTTPPSMAPGSIWPKLSSPLSPANALTGASAASNCSNKRPYFGKPDAMRRPSK